MFVKFYCIIFFQELVASFPHMTYIPNESSRELMEGHQTSQGEYVTVPKLRHTSSENNDGHHELERSHRHRKHSYMSHQHMNHYSHFGENFNRENYPKIDPLNIVTPSAIKHGKYYYVKKTVPNIPQEGNTEENSTFNSVERRDKKQNIFKQDLEAILHDFYEKLRMFIENKNTITLPKDDNQVNKEHRESFTNKKSKLKPVVDRHSIETSSTEENSDITNAKQKFQEIIIVKKPNIIDFSPTTDVTNKLNFLDIVKGSDERDTEPPLAKASTDKTSYIYVKGSYQTETSVKTDAPENLITIVKRKKHNKTKIPRSIRTPRL